MCSSDLAVHDRVLDFGALLSKGVVVESTREPSTFLDVNIEIEALEQVMKVGHPGALARDPPEMIT